MKAIAVAPSTTQVRLIDRSGPSFFASGGPHSISPPYEVKVRIVRVGICRTDREEAMGGRALVPTDQQDLVIGHEIFGAVVETGRAVTRVVQLGDYAVFTVRCGCGKCMPCSMNRPDMCRIGDYRERGIWGADGYQTEFLVDKEQYVGSDQPRQIGVNRAAVREDVHYANDPK
jgi:glucose 1-dehydrogenase